MDAIKAEIARKTINIGLGDGEIWRTRYEPFYSEPPEDIRIIRDMQYGPDVRNRLDVYVPPGNHHQKPVILYLHGGGFVSGDKQWSEKCYANIGHFFARQGMITVIANYRLVPNVVYPGGADDVQLMREWIYSNISAYEYGEGSIEKVILLGHSAGGAHIAMNLYAAGDVQGTLRNPIHPPVAGVVYLDVPFWYDRTKPVRQNTIRNYYGSDTVEVWAPKSALGLFERLPADSSVLDSRRLPVHVGITEWEIPETSDANIMFLKAYWGKSRPEGTLPDFHVLKGHNHWSDVLSIGTEDTAQSDSLMRFVKACLGSNQELRL